MVGSYNFIETILEIYTPKKEESKRMHYILQLISSTLKMENRLAILLDSKN